MNPADVNRKNFTCLLGSLIVFFFSGMAKGLLKRSPNLLRQDLLQSEYLTRNLNRLKPGPYL